MQSSFDDEAFREAEERVDQGIYRDYREAGEALRQIRDEQQDQWRPTYGTWGQYVERRHGICRQTAAYMIRAAEVAADLSSRDDTLRLPARHANLLARFKDSDVRLELAIKIQPLSFREASRLVIDFSKELLNTTPPPPKPGRSDERSETLAQLDGILRGCEALDGPRLAQAARGLGEARRRRLARRTKVAARVLIDVSAKIAPEDSEKREAETGPTSRKQGLAVTPRRKDPTASPRRHDRKETMEPRKLYLVTPEKTKGNGDHQVQ